MPIRKIAKKIGVTVDTIRRWEKEGKISSERTSGGHRRYDMVEDMYLYYCILSEVIRKQTSSK